MDAVKDFNSLLSDLKSHRDSKTYSMYIPSQQQESEFKPITVTQQSDIISSLLVQERDANAYSYNKIINDIIQANSVSSSEEFRSFDRPAILIQMRVNTIGSNIIVDSHDINLSDIIPSFTLTDTELELLNSDQTYSNKGITVNFKVPFLTYENQLATAAENKWKDLEGEDIITELFVIELVKYITSISFDDQEIVFNDITFSQKLEACNLLPMSHSRKIMEYVQRVKKIEDKFHSIDIDDTNVMIPLNTALFSTGT